MPRRKTPSRNSSRPPQPPPEQYADDVLAGRIIAGELLRATVRRHREDLRSGHRRGLRFAPARAQRVLDLFALLHHSKGRWAGQRFELAAWQQFVLWVLFGWERADGTRRFREGFVDTARKNGKSTLAAGCGLYLAFADGEGGAEVYAAATKRAQARIVHGEAANMVRRSPALRRHIEIWKDNLCCIATASSFVPLANDFRKEDGLNVHGAIIDELHAHPNGELFEILNTATGARDQPLILTITTPGKRGGYYDAKREYAEQVARGTIRDDAFAAFIFAPDPGDDAEDETTWAKANPSLGITIKPDTLREEYARAKQFAPSLEAFLRLRLGIRTSSVATWIPADLWQAGGRAIDADSLAGQPCRGGLDLANSLDLAAFVLLFQSGQVLPFFWCPEEMPNRQPMVAAMLSAWGRQGLIRMTPGDTIDYDTIRADVNAIGQRHTIEEIEYDPWNATQLANQLTDDGFRLERFDQRMANFTEPCKELQRRLRTRSLQHGGHPVLDWMARNVVVRTNAAGQMMPDRKASADKIDGIVALLMAIGSYLRRPAEAAGGPSVFVV